MNHQFISKMITCYTVSTCLYGFIHSVAYNYDSSKKYYQKSTASYEPKQKLLADKLGSVALGTAAAPVVWPIMFWEDLMHLECVARGKDPAEYGE